MKHGIVRVILVLFFMVSVSLSASAATEQTWTVNLKDADIRAFVTQVSDITGYSFVIDPRVKGKVTVISNVPMSRDQVYEMFLSVLQVHDFTAIPGKDVIKVVRQNDAKQTAENLSMLHKVPSEQLVTRVIQINNANALELVPILRPMVAKYGHLAGVAAANALIISDHIANIERLSNIVDELDSPSKYELEVIQLQDAWVGDMVKLLEELAPGELNKGGAKSPNKFSVVADERSNRLILKGDVNFRDKMRELIDKLDQPAVSSGTTKVIRLKHADAESLAEILKGLLGDLTSEQKEKKGNTKGQSAASVYADEGLNALVIRADPTIVKEIEEIIYQLDIRRAQVLIEAAIVELEDNGGEGLGVQWAFYDQDGAVPGMLMNFKNLGISATTVLGAIASGDNTTAASAASGAVDGVSFGFGQSREGGISWGAFVQALSTATNANLLSTPKLITMDNQESSIHVGENIPIITGQSTSTGSGVTNPFTTISREDVGVKLKVTPSISDGDVVRLEIEQESSSIGDSVENASDIVTKKRVLNTHVMADNGETIVLGGLIRDDITKSVSKVPLLGDIPYLGALFRSTSESRTKKNLLVFLRPTILRDKDIARDVSQKKYDSLWELNLNMLPEEQRKERTKPALDTLFEKNLNP